MNAFLLRVCFGLLGVATAAAQSIPIGPIIGTPATPAPLKIGPPFDLQSIALTLTEDTSVPVGTGRSLADLAAAIGGTIGTNVPLLGTDRYVALRLFTEVKLGQAYRAAQNFDFGSPSRWKVKSIEPNLFVYFPEGVPFSAKRVFNFSARAEVRTGENATIGGLVVPGTITQLAVIKVRGASLGAFGVSQPLANPVVRLYQGSTLILQNDNWSSLRAWELEVARPICSPPEESRESMLVTYLDPGAYTAIISGANGETGVAVLEFYLLDWFNVTSAN